MYHANVYTTFGLDDHFKFTEVSKLKKIEFT